jgi:hypothetical protein
VNKIDNPCVARKPMNPERWLRSAITNPIVKPAIIPNGNDGIAALAFKIGDAIAASSFKRSGTLAQNPRIEGARRREPD